MALDYNAYKTIQQIIEADIKQSKNNSNNKFKLTEEWLKENCEETRSIYEEEPGYYKFAVAFKISNSNKYFYDPVGIKWYKTSIKNKSLILQDCQHNNPNSIIHMYNDDDLNWDKPNPSVRSYMESLGYTYDN